MLLALPLEIWCMIFDLLSGQDLQSISKVPKLLIILATSPILTHRLEVYKAGMVETPFAGSRPLAERSELLKAVRARWESLRWTGVTRLLSSLLYHSQIARTTLVYTTFETLSIINHTILPFGGIPPRSWEDRQLALSVRAINAFSAYFQMNSLVVLEQWRETTWALRVRLHVRRLNPARDITAPHDGQLKVCEPFTANINLPVDTYHEWITSSVDQNGRHVGMLFVCFSLRQPGCRAKFKMWDVITQVQVVNISSLEYQSFLFLDHHWVLFGGIHTDPDPDADCLYHPYLDITNPTDNTRFTRLELDEPCFKRPLKNPTAQIRVCSGADREKDPYTESGGVPFVSDAFRGVVGVEVSWSHSEHFELRVFVLNIEGVLSKVPSPPNLGQRCKKWKDLSSSTATFSYDSESVDKHATLSRPSYVAGFRYVSPTLSLDPKDPMGPRCFFVYDFNPHREAPDPLPDFTPEEPDPETGYRRSASEITREVVGGLSCWKMRFDLPAPDEDLDECRVALTDGGPVLFEAYRSRMESVTVFSIW